ncbi:MAG: hypothetical protein ACW98X_17795 [Promethearchaeota archaeon]
MASVFIVGGLIKWIKHKLWSKQHKLEKANELLENWLNENINNMAEAVEGWRAYSDLPEESKRIMYDLESCSKMLLIVKTTIQHIREYGEEWEDAAEREYRREK